LEKDPVIQIAREFSQLWYSMMDKMDPYDEKISRNKRIMLEGLMKLYPDSNFYPNANFTMRLTYGKVKSYVPGDAVTFNYYTTSKGVIEKYIPGDADFDVPELLIHLIKNKDFGRYGNKDYITTCFITNNDITGGNSGSPALNSKGELIGTVFDGNWESMSGDICFVKNKQRCIVSDIRYILFILEKFAGMNRLIEEMEIVE
jgi:hypothetical protein